MYLIFPDAYDKVNDCVIQDRILSGRRQKHTAPGLWERGKRNLCAGLPGYERIGGCPSNCHAVRVRATVVRRRSDRLPPMPKEQKVFCMCGVCFLQQPECGTKKHPKGCLCPMQRCGCFVENINSVSETPGSGVGKAAEKNLSVIFLKNY